MAASNGSQKGWVLAVVREHELTLARYARRIIGDVEQASDLVQHAFARLCQESPATVRNPGQWLFTVVRNRAIDLQRKGQRMQSLSDSDCLHYANGPAPDALAEARDTLAQLRRALAALPAAQQEVVDLWAEGFSYKEISQITSRSETNIRVMVHRAMQALREHPLVKGLLAVGHT